MDAKRNIALMVVCALVGAGVLLWQGTGRKVEPRNTESTRRSPESASGTNAGVTPQVAATLMRQQEPGAVRTVSTVRPVRALPQSPLVTQLLSSDPAIRNGALRGLTRQLSSNDVATLLAFLEAPPGRYAGLKPLAYNAVRNDVLDVLMRQDRAVAGLGLKVVAMIHDPAQDEVWRDYCVQYLAGCYSRVGETDARHSESVRDERQAILDTYWETVGWKDKGTSGTALIGLESLSRETAAVDRERLGREALRLAGDEAASESARITALRVCGMLKCACALEPVRIAAQAGTSELVRMAGLATLGELGEKSDLEYLAALLPQVKGREKPVMEAAVRKLNQRYGLNGGVQDQTRATGRRL